jgi:putative ABC transport system permease protein
VLSFLVCVVGVANAMLMSVTERFRDIGTMKCLGALSSFVRAIFLLEASFMGAVGGALGVLLGFLFAMLSYLVPYGAELSLEALAKEPGALVLASLGSLVAGVVLSVVAALYPANLAARMVPADALRSNV